MASIWFGVETGGLSLEELHSDHMVWLDFNKSWLCELESHDTQLMPEPDDIYNYE